MNSWGSLLCLCQVGKDCLDDFREGAHRDEHIPAHFHGRDAEHGIRFDDHAFQGRHFRAFALNFLFCDVVVVRFPQNSHDAFRVRVRNDFSIHERQAGKGQNDAGIVKRSASVTASLFPLRAEGGYVFVRPDSLLFAEAPDGFMQHAVRQGGRGDTAGTEDSPDVIPGYPIEFRNVIHGGVFRPRDEDVAVGNAENFLGFPAFPEQDRTGHCVALDILFEFELDFSCFLWHNVVRSFHDVSMEWISRNVIAVTFREFFICFQFRARRSGREVKTNSLTSGHHVYYTIYY